MYSTNDNYAELQHQTMINGEWEHLFKWCFRKKKKISWLLKVTLHFENAGSKVKTKETLHNDPPWESLHYLLCQLTVQYWLDIPKKKNCQTEEKILKYSMQMWTNFIKSNREDWQRNQILQNKTKRLYHQGIISNTFIILLVSLNSFAVVIFCCCSSC